MMRFAAREVHHAFELAPERQGAGLLVGKGIGRRLPCAVGLAALRDRPVTQPHGTRSPSSIQTLWSSLEGRADGTRERPPAGRRPAASPRSAVPTCHPLERQRGPSGRAAARRGVAQGKENARRPRAWKPPCIGRSSQPAASACHGRGQAAKPTSMATRWGVPTSPRVHPVPDRRDGKGRGEGKVHRAPAPASATKALASATSIERGFSQNTVLPAVSVRAGMREMRAGGEAM